MLASNPERLLRHGSLLCLILGAAACAQGGSSGQYTYSSTRYHYTSAASYYPHSAPPAVDYAAPHLQWPVSAGVVSSRFGLRHGGTHRGIDIAAPLGTPIRAAASGKVVFAGRMHGYGKTIILRHDAHRETLYAHNRKLWVVQGQYVSRGQEIAAMGRSGHASGPNLHFEVRVDNYAQNPLHYLESRPYLITFAK